MTPPFGFGFGNWFSNFPVWGDINQVFWGLMNKTMWDVKFGNTGWGGYNPGNFTNSCWNSMNWQLPSAGDSYQFNNSRNNTSIEEKKKNAWETKKFNALKQLMNDYKNKLDADSKERSDLEVELDSCKTYSSANYAKLQELYNANKDDIKQKLPRTRNEITPQETSITAAKYLKDTLGEDLNLEKLKTVLKTDGNEIKAELVDGVNATEMLYSLQTTSKKSFSAMYKNTFDKADSTTDKAELRKLIEALYSKLAAEATDLTELPEGDTKTTIEELRNITPDNVTAEHIDALYYWIRVAKAEIAEGKYSCLKEDFAGDDYFGASDGVNTTETELKDKEGLDVEKIKTVSSVVDFNAMENDEARMNHLVSLNLQTPLTEAQITELKKISGVKKFLEDNKITKLWVDTSSQVYRQRFIRVLDADGNLKCLTGVVMDKDANGNFVFKAIEKPLIGGAAEKGKIGISNATPFDNMKAQSKTVAEVEAELDKSLTEIKKLQNNGRRVFEEKEITGDRDYKRLFVIEPDGKLKEWKNIRYASNCFVKVDNSNNCPCNDITLDTIKDDAKKMNDARSAEENSIEYKTKKAINNASFSETDLEWAGQKDYLRCPDIELNDKGNAEKSKEIKRGRYHIWPKSGDFSDWLKKTDSFQDLYNEDVVIELFVLRKYGGKPLDIASYKMNYLANAIVAALCAGDESLDKKKLEESAQQVANSILQKYETKTEIDDYEEMGDSGVFKTDQRNKNNSTHKTLRNKCVMEPGYHVGKDTDGQNSLVGMINFKYLVDEILKAYYAS